MFNYGSPEEVRSPSALHYCEVATSWSTSVHPEAVKACFHVRTAEEVATVLPNQYWIV
jgi:hypothetical protein